MKTDDSPRWLIHWMGRPLLTPVLALAMLLASGLCTGCATHGYRAAARSPAEGAQVFGSQRFYSYTVLLATIDGCPPAPPRWYGSAGPFLIDPGPRVLGVHYRQANFAESFINKYHHVELKLAANLSAGHTYHLKSARTNEWVTLWVEDDKSNEPVSLKVTAFAEPSQDPIINGSDVVLGGGQLFTSILLGLH